jgi:hypothetical protein
MNELEQSQTEYRFSNQRSVHIGDLAQILHVKVLDHDCFIPYFEQF